MGKQKTTRKLNSWEKAIKYILVYKLKITKKNKNGKYPKTKITTDKVLKHKLYLIAKFPDNKTLRNTVINTLNRLTKIGFLVKSDFSWKLNKSYNQPRYFTVNRLGKNVKLGDCDLELFEGFIYAITPNGYRIKLGEGIN